MLVQYHQQLPRQLAEVSGATTPGFSGPLPPAPKFVFESSSFRWSVFGSPPLCVARSVFWGRRPFVPPLPGAGVPTDPQSPEGGSQWCRITRGVPTPRLLGALKRWCCFGSHTLPLRTVALLTQSYPAELEVTLLQLGIETSTSRSFGGRSPRW